MALSAADVTEGDGAAEDVGKEAGTGESGDGFAVRRVRAGQVAETIDAAERNIRAAEPMVTSLYLEPDIYRADYVPDPRPEAPAPSPRI